MQALPDAGHLEGEGAQVALYAALGQILVFADEMSRIATTDAQSRVYTTLYRALEPIADGLGILNQIL